MKLTQTLWMFGIVGALLGSAVTQSLALPNNEVEIVYFSDATFTQEVGYEYRGCQGGVSRQGRTSRYRAASSTPCNSSRPMEIACFINGRETWCPANICDSELFNCQ